MQRQQGGDHSPRGRHLGASRRSRRGRAPHPPDDADLDEHADDDHETAPRRPEHRQHGTGQRRRRQRGQRQHDHARRTAQQVQAVGHDEQHQCADRHDPRQRTGERAARQHPRPHAPARGTITVATITATAATTAAPPRSRDEPQRRRRQHHQRGHQERQGRGERRVRPGLVALAVDQSRRGELFAGRHGHRPAGLADLVRDGLGHAVESRGAVVEFLQAAVDLLGALIELFGGSAQLAGAGGRAENAVAVRGTRRVELVRQLVGAPAETLGLPGQSVEVDGAELPLESLQVLHGRLIACGPRRLLRRADRRLHLPDGDVDQADAVGDGPRPAGDVARPATELARGDLQFVEAG